MRYDKIEIYAHLIWTTYDRHPLITPELEADLFPVLCEMVERHGGKTLAVNGVPDHVHMLVKYSSTTRTCDLIKDVKGASSSFLNEQLGDFKWRPTYAAFSVSRWDVNKIANYIARQKEHHAEGTIIEALEAD